MKEIKDILASYDRHKEQPGERVLATVVHIEDSSYRRIGARMLVQENGQWIGGISGGCLEGDALRQAKQVMLSGRPKVVTYDTRERDAYQIGVGLGCEGRIDVLLQKLDQEAAPIAVLRRLLGEREECIVVTVYGSSDADDALIGKTWLANSGQAVIPDARLREPLEEAQRQKRSIVQEIAFEDRTLSVLFEWVSPNIRLVIAGDNYDVHPVIRYAHQLGWEVVLMGKGHKIHKEDARLLAALLSRDQLDQVESDRYTAVLAMSHDYDTDIQVLDHFLEKPVGYLGVLGPRKRFRRMLYAMERPEDAMAHVHNPLGLDIGAASPEEIGLSILAEVVKTFRGGTGQSLKEKGGFIHAR